MLEARRSAPGRGQRGRGYWITQRRSCKKLSPAAVAAQAGKLWPCPLGACMLCRRGGGIDPAVIVAAQNHARRRLNCTRDDAAAVLGVKPRRLSEVLDGTDLDPLNTRIGPAQRREAAETLLRLLVKLAEKPTANQA